MQFQLGQLRSKEKKCTFDVKGGFKSFQKEKFAFHEREKSMGKTFLSFGGRVEVNLGPFSPNRFRHG